MVTIIVIGHGKFAIGLKSALELIVGKQKNIAFVNFEETDSQEILEKKIRQSIKGLKCEDNLLFLTDLVGGTPFKTSAIISAEFTSTGVVGGVNLPLLLEILLHREDMDASQLVKKAINYGKEGINTFSI